MSEYRITLFSTSKTQPKRSLFIFFRPKGENHFKNSVCLLFFSFFLGVVGVGGVAWIALTSFYTCRYFNGFIVQVISDIRSRFSIYSSHHLPCQSEDLFPWKTGTGLWNPHSRPVQLFVIFISSHYLMAFFYGKTWEPWVILRNLSLDYDLTIDSQNINSNAEECITFQLAHCSQEARVTDLFSRALFNSHFSHVTVELC